MLAIDPSNDHAIERLRSLYEQRREWPKLLELERRELERIPNELRVAKAVEIARLAASKSGSSDVAIEWWRRVLEYEPRHLLALSELTTILEAQGRWSEVKTVLEKRIEVAKGDDYRIDALCRLAKVHEQHLVDPTAALQTWKRVLAINPAHEEAIRALGAKPVQIATANAVTQAAPRSAMEVARAVVKEVDALTSRPVPMTFSLAASVLAYVLVSLFTVVAGAGGVVKGQSVGWLIVGLGLIGLVIALASRPVRVEVDATGLHIVKLIGASQSFKWENMTKMAVGRLPGRKYTLNIWLDSSEEPIDLALYTSGKQIRRIGELAIRMAGFVLTQRSRDVFEGDKPR